jgi:hypothetical protein
MDGSIWTELDRHIDNQTTSSNHLIDTFSVSNHFECQTLSFFDKETHDGESTVFGFPFQPVTAHRWILNYFVSHDGELLAVCAESVLQIHRSFV